MIIGMMMRLYAIVTGTYKDAPSQTTPSGYSEV